jgi:transcriptional regulator with XRE-family HTH domain
VPCAVKGPIVRDVAEPDHRAGLFPALLKHWRRQHGLSQLDLALAADVSARHVSFLETGRSIPSADMVLRLAAVLGIPLRQVNAMLRAAGHEAVYDESDASLPPTIVDALDLLKNHHEPFPLVVVDNTYRIRDLNQGARTLLGVILGDSTGPTDGMNLARMTFDPNGARPFIVNFDEVGRQLLWRIQREALADPNGELHDLLDDLLAQPTVDPNWRQVDLSVPSEPVLVLHLRYNDLDLRFLTLITAFQAPQNVTVEHLRIETWFPYDQATADVCTALAQL